MVAPATHARGMTLVDLLVATVMLGVSVVVLMGLSGRALSAQRSGENLQIAAMILDEQLNLVQARGADDYASRYDDSEGVAEAPYEAFRYRVEISGGDSGDAYRVVATVSWEEYGQTKSATVETRIAPRRGEEPDPDRRPATEPDRLAGGAP
ncbi:MAG: hypothetical protein SFY69_01345 [Planctomycetota bacterium]|nr:hypothetical protein [Planctomycetota bacterium]